MLKNKRPSGSQHAKEAQIRGFPPGVTVKLMDSIFGSAESKPRSAFLGTLKLGAFKQFFDSMPGAKEDNDTTMMSAEVIVRGLLGLSDEASSQM